MRKASRYGRLPLVGSAKPVDTDIVWPLGFSSMRFRPLLALVLAFCLTFVTACSGGAKAVERSNVTYDDIRNTGKANDCPTLSESVSYTHLTLPTICSV